MTEKKTLKSIVAGRSTFVSRVMPILIAAGILLSLVIGGMCLITLREAEHRSLEQFAACTDSEATAVNERIASLIHQLDTAGGYIANTVDKAEVSEALRLLPGIYVHGGILFPDGRIITDPHCILSETQSTFIRTVLVRGNGRAGEVSSVFSDSKGSYIMTAVPMHDEYEGCILYGSTNPAMLFGYILDFSLYDETIGIWSSTGECIYVGNRLSRLMSSDALADTIAGLTRASADGSSVSTKAGGYAISASLLSYNGWVLVRMETLDSFRSPEMVTATDILFPAVGALLLLIVCAAILYGIAARGSSSLRVEAETDALTDMYNMNGFIKAANIFLSNSSAHYATIVLRTNVSDVYRIRTDLETKSAVYADIGRILNAECENGECCARLDSGEFALLLRYASTADLLLRIKSLHDRLMSNLSMHCSMHFGICYATDDRSTAEELTACAAEAAARILRSGDPIGVYDETLHEQRINEEEMAAMAKEALKNHEFEVLYRPLTDVASLEKVAAEAITVWKRSDGRILLSDEYEDILQRHSLLGDVNDFTLDKVLSDIRSEMDAGRLPERVIVPFSRRNLVDGGYIIRLKELKNKYGLDGSSLEISLYESVFSEDTALIANMVNMIHEEGMRISVASVGRGAALNQLANIPVDALKLNRELAAHAFDEEGSVGRRFLEGIVKLCAFLNVDLCVSGDLSFASREAYGACGINTVSDVECSPQHPDSFCTLAQVRQAKSKADDDPFSFWEN